MMDFYQQPLEQHYQRPQCNCHECTQARWKSSIQGQIDAAMKNNQKQQAEQPQGAD